ncbi:MAG TPA: hypothetical protein PKK10_06935 [Woeseiaceae bacterium]|nr:hypothetical protein [Woeseiaceae bacterium]
MKIGRTGPLLLLWLAACACLSTHAEAAYRAPPQESVIVFEGDAHAEFELTRDDGMTLSEAVDSVRRRGNVERIISAETRVSGGREVHVIRFMTRDGKVKTEKIAGQARN